MTNRITWHGSTNPTACPVAPGTRIKLWLDADQYPLETNTPEAMKWDHTGAGDITSYEIVE